MNSGPPIPPMPLKWFIGWVALMGVIAITQFLNGGHRQDLADPLFLVGWSVPWLAASYGLAWLSWRSGGYKKFPTK